MGNILIKTLRDTRFFILGWSLGLAFLGYLMTIFFPSFSGGEIDQLVSTMPPALQGLVGELQDWRELPGYIGSQLYDIRLPMFVSVLAILLAIRISVTEEGKGQLRTLLALPYSRRSVVMGKWGAIVVVCAAASLATTIGIVVGSLQIQASIDWAMLARLGAFTWLQVTALATLIFALGIATGARSLTTTGAVCIAIGGFLLSTFAPAVEWLQSIEWLSFFSYFPAVEVAKGIVSWQDVAVYGVLTITALVGALIAFARRDIRTA